jgi:hypothetical protein
METRNLTALAKEDMYLIESQDLKRLSEMSS